ncbi:MAG TPA: hypothetical protein VJ952_12810 [Opitutales bacterium]|nr:hypothetical protein [Opitutales bacterium]
MKLLYSLSLLLFSLCILGCASSGAKETAEEAEAPSAEGAAPKMNAKTAYEGSTGSGLLMERYKAGQIEGYRD